jgi:hypothetical protein
MDSNSLFKKLTLVRLGFYTSVFCGLLISQIASGENTPSNVVSNVVVSGNCSYDSTQPTTKPAFDACLATQNKTARCDKATDTFNSQRSDWSGCASSAKIIQACHDAIAENGGESEADNAVKTSHCSGSILPQCYYQNPSSSTDLNSQSTDALSAAKQADTELTNAQKTYSAALSQQKKALTDEQKTMRDADQAQAQNIQKLGNNLKSSMSQADAAVQKAYSDAMDKFNQIDQQYIQLRDQLRRAKSAVLAAQSQLTVVCKGKAYSQYKAAEEALNKRIDAENSVLKNQGFAGLAGYAKRQNKLKHQNQSTDYANYFNDCMNANGSDPDGAKQRDAINSAQLAEQDDEKMLTDKAATLETQRQQILQQLKQIEASTATDKQNMVTQANQLQANLQTNYANQTKDAKDAYSQAMTDAQNEMSAAQSNMTNAGNYANELHQKSLVAHNALICGSSPDAPQLSDTKKEAIQKCDDSGDLHQSACDTLKLSCTDGVGAVDSSCSASAKVGTDGKTLH